MNSPPGKTMFGGQIKPAINFVDRTGQDMNGMRFFKAGYAGAWFARCLSCGRELLLTKDVIRRGKQEMLRDENVKTDRPVYGMTVLRYEDGRTELVTDGILSEETPVPQSPTAWQHRHAMLIDACELVKREAGVELSGDPGGLAEPAFVPHPVGFHRRVANQLRLCPGCRSTDGEHTFGATCTLTPPEEPAFQASSTIASAEQEGS